MARGLLVAPPRPPPAAVGDDAPRRARGRALGAGDQDAPLPRRRRRLDRHRARPARRLARTRRRRPPQPLPGAGRGGRRARHGRFWLSPGLVVRGARAGVGAALHPRESLDRVRAAAELIVREEVIGAPHVEPERADERHAPLRHRALGPRRRQGDEERASAARSTTSCSRSAPAGCATCCSRAARRCPKATARAGAGEHPHRGQGARARQRADVAVRRAAR